MSVFSNRLIVSANTQDELKTFLKSITNGNEFDLLNPEIFLFFDLNKITPMPEELKNTICSIHIDCAIYYYIVKTNQEDSLKHILYNPNYHNMDHYKSLSQEDLNKMFEIGKKYVELYHKYGYRDWCDWSIKNWGTKWNAYNTDVEFVDECTAIITFDTIFAGIPNLIAKLVENYPALAFEYFYADEKIAHDCGKGWGEDGEFTFTKYTENSFDAMNTFLICWQDEASDYYLDENGIWRKHEWVDEDEENEDWKEEY